MRNSLSVLTLVVFGVSPVGSTELRASLCAKLSGDEEVLCLYDWALSGNIELPEWFLEECKDLIEEHERNKEVIKKKYAECILQHMKGVTSDKAAIETRRACRTLSN